MAYIGVQPADAYTSFAVQHFTTSATDTFTLDFPVANENEIALFINNVRQEPGSSYAYTASGTTLTLSSAITGSDSMYCVFIGKAVQTVTPTLPIANFSSTGIDDNATSTAVTILSSGFVGVGQTNPTTNFHVGDDSAGNENTSIRIEGGSTSGYSQVHFADSGDVNVGRVQYTHSSNTMALYTNDTERMRIDSSGNVLVGKTSANYTSKGVWLKGSDGQNYFTSESQPTIHINRLTSNGELIKFNKDGSSAGVIGVLNTELFIGSGSYLNFGGTRIIPATSSGGNRDNVIDLGNSASRFDDIFATNGTIQTSDQNEKQSIQSLTASEIAVAQRISKLFKTFKWNSAVEEKGDNARTHTGIIAQDVQQAFTDEGLDASNYALFISSTWWEKEISVDAVAEELDEEGNVVVEGQDAYTYIDTKDEATEGYTQRTRLGIRYPELLSFVSSAFEQRLTNIETRLETLENA